MGIKAGCGGFRVARKRYFDQLPTVEVSDAFFKPPKPAIAAAWRSEAPREFEFSLPASQIVTHQADTPGYSKLPERVPERRRAFCGHFKDTPEVAAAWDATRAVAEALEARFIVFETPYSFYPDSNHLRDMYRFFKSAERGRAMFIWQPRGAWDDRLIGKVCRDLGLVRARDVIEAPAEPARELTYLRLPKTGYTAGELAVLRRLGDRAPAYAYFTHRAGWLEARKVMSGRPL